MNENLFFHVHIGKTAGQTFNTILQRNFSPRMLMEYPMLFDVPFPREHVRWYVELYNYRCISSHNLRWKEIPYEEFPGLYAISFVRDPVRRLVSNYYYQRARKDVQHDCYVNRYSLEELIYMVLKKGFSAPYSLNSQLHSLVNDDTLGKVKKLAGTGHFCLFQTERFNEACVLLERLYPNDFRDCAFPKSVNETPAYTRDDPNVIKIVEQLPYIEADQMLHKFSGEYMDSLIDGLFENREAFEFATKDFERRCQDKAASFNHFLSEKKAWLAGKIKNTAWSKKIK